MHVEDLDERRQARDHDDSTQARLAVLIHRTQSLDSPQTRARPRDTGARSSCEAAIVSVRASMVRAASVAGQVHTAPSYVRCRLFRPREKSSGPSRVSRVALLRGRHVAPLQVCETSAQSRITATSALRRPAPRMHAALVRSGIRGLATPCYALALLLRRQTSLTASDGADPTLRSQAHALSAHRAHRASSARARSRTGAMSSKGKLRASVRQRSLGTSLTAAACSLVQTQAQFKREGCMNCECV